MFIEQADLAFEGAADRHHRIPQRVHFPLSRHVLQLLGHHRQRRNQQFDIAQNLANTVNLVPVIAFISFSIMAVAPFLRR